MIQLARPEYVFVHSQELPDFILEEYFKNQEHSSLRRLLEKGMVGCEEDYKLMMIYTTTSLDVHTLEDSHIIREDQDIERDIEVDFKRMRHYISGDVEKIFVVKLGSIRSQELLREVVNIFMTSDNNLLLFICDMEVVTIHQVNYTRILIEEELEGRGKSGLVSFLIHHHPTSSEDLYPVLFLNKWDHHYLDSVDDENFNGLHPFNVQSWMGYSVFEDDNDMRGLIDDVTEQITKSFLQESVTSFCAGMGNFPQNEKTLLFHPDITSIERNEVIYDCLTRSIGDGENSMTLGNVLIEKFMNLLGGEMNKLLLDVCERLINVKSGQGLLDFVQTDIKDSFKDFMRYSLFLLSKSFDLDLFTDESDENKGTLSLFLKTLGSIDFATLEEIKIRNSSFTISSDQISQTCSSKFPLFGRISDLVQGHAQKCCVKWVKSRKDSMFDIENTGEDEEDGGIEEAKDGIMDPRDFTNKKKNDDVDENEKFIKFCDKFLGGVFEEDSPSTNLMRSVLERIKSDKDLWMRYLHDFIFS